MLRAPLQKGRVECRHTLGLAHKLKVGSLEHGNSLTALRWHSGAWKQRAAITCGGNKEWPVSAEEEAVHRGSHVSLRHSLAYFEPPFFRAYVSLCSWKGVYSLVTWQNLCHCSERSVWSLKHGAGGQMGFGKLKKRPHCKLEQLTFPFVPPDVVTNGAPFL